ncbi:pentapeptide repeat-containing protein [Vibrio tritonius]|uniref:Pentapeptide repeat-containing protein n=1 Tax=Vibrio tritonius TaxID=1435069 RepID=A0ABS7YP12_9VIBR|nr:pentapeptide repeat-containing protein [Vibrio tritonius]MCA2017410.1 pentapeptide repeat-containing protein [Vibrio tritonius]
MTHILHHYQAADVQQVSRLIETHGPALKGMRFQRVNFDQQAFLGVHFEQCEFVECSFIEADLSGVHFSDCTFVSTPQACDFTKANLTDVHFTRCDLTYAKWQDVQALGVQLNTCQLGHMIIANANFATDINSQSRFMMHQCDCEGIDLRDLVIDGVNLTQCQWRDIKVNHVVMSHCNFTGSLLNASDAVEWNLSYSDLREADIVNIDQNTTNLAGAYVNEYQANALNLGEQVRIA